MKTEKLEKARKLDSAIIKLDRVLARISDEKFNSGELYIGYIPSAAIWDDFVGSMRVEVTNQLNTLKKEFEAL